MAASDAFMVTCRALVAALPELAAFRAALLALETAGDDQQRARWQDAYGDARTGLSPAYRLRRAVRDVVIGQAEALGAGSLGPADREDAYRRLAAEVVPDVRQPDNPDEERRTLELLALNALIGDE